MASNLNDELWEETRRALHESRSIAELQTGLAAIHDGTEATMILAFLTERDAGAVAGEAERVLEEALERIAYTDPSALPLLALLRDA